jgi:hypothetical protein
MRIMTDAPNPSEATTMLPTIASAPLAWRQAIKLLLFAVVLLLAAEPSRAALFTACANGETI